jgi:uncharacterized protein with HEPN domain
MRHRNPRKYLYDIQRAAGLLGQFILAKTFADYQKDEMLRAAVEREFAIIGEAISQLARSDETLAARISQYQRITPFRNILIHQYIEVDDRMVWDVVENDLPALAGEVDALLEEG